MTSQTLKLLGALRRIGQSLDSYSKSIEHSAGLTLPQLLVLEALRNAPAALTAGGLAQQVSLTQGTVTAILDRLEDRGLISRARAAEDRRRVLVALTDDGRRKLRSTPPLLRAEFVERYAALDAAERDALTSALERIAELMRVDPPQPSPNPNDKESPCVALPASADSMDSSPISTQ